MTGITPQAEQATPTVEHALLVAELAEQVIKAIYPAIVAAVLEALMRAEGERHE